MQERLYLGNDKNFPVDLLEQNRMEQGRAEILRPNKTFQKASYFYFIAALVALGMAGIMHADAQKSQKTALSDDPSLGRVIDREGVGSIKPVLQDRWSVANENMKLEAGDLVMTGTRGANALTLRMTNGGSWRK